MLSTLVNGQFVGDPTVQELRVDGQFTGRGVDMVARNVLGRGQHIFAQGTTERFMGNTFPTDPGRIAGPATGPDGDRGDWLAVNETHCARVVSLQPIRDDGSGGDVTLVTECVSYRSRTLRPIPQGLHDVYASTVARRVRLHQRSSPRASRLPIIPPPTNQPRSTI